MVSHPKLDPASITMNLRAIFSNYVSTISKGAKLSCSNSSRLSCRFKKVSFKNDKVLTGFFEDSEV